MEPTTASDSAARTKTLSPAEVHNVAFKKPPIGKRGYDEEEVDFFLDVVETELSRLIEENEKLKRSAVDHDQPPGSAGPTDGDLGQADHPLVEENGRLTAALAEAEGRAAAAEQHLEQARVEAAEAIEQAGTQAGASSPPASVNSPDSNQQAVKVLALAQQTADQHLATAQQEADTLVSDARTTAEELERQSTADAQRRVAEAAEAADALRRDSQADAAKAVADAEDQTAAISGALETRKSALERRIQELSAFEGEYRSRLKSYLESQLRDLEQGTDEGGQPTE